MLLEFFTSSLILSHLFRPRPACLIYTGLQLFRFSEFVHLHWPLVGATQAEEAKHMLGSTDDQKTPLDVHGLYEKQHGVYVL